MNSTQHSRRRASTRLFGLCLGTAAIVAIPSVALGAAAGSPTVRAAIRADGSVSSVKQYAADGTASAFSGELPVTLSISHTSAGGATTYTYHVANTLSETQTVHYTDTAGNERHTSTTLQLPLVAQLGVDVPKSMTDLVATGASVTTDADGTRHVLWNMVLFAPLGSSAQDVSLTAGGSGSPVAALRATPVDPTTTQGLGVKSQDLTAAFQQDDFWAGYAHGGNDGLTQLSDGMGQLVDGLVQAYAGAQQLHQGLADGLSGTQQAADGSTQLYNGSKQLTSGIAQIHGGLVQLADPKKGLPAAVDGLDQILAGIGDKQHPKTLIGGESQIVDGLAQLVDGFGTVNDFQNPGLVFGLACAQDVLELVVNGNPTAVSDHCFDSPPFFGTKPVLPALSTVSGTALYSLILGGLNTQAMTPINEQVQTLVAPGLVQLRDGSQQLLFGMSHKPGAAGASDPGGLKQGVKQVRDGVNTAVVKGIKPLAAGTGPAPDAALGGSRQITDGLQQLSSGLVDGAKSFPQAVDGAGQLADGLGQAVDGGKQINDGMDQVHSGATGPLESQLKQASRNAHEQLAVLQAATGMAAKAPGGAGTSYVLSQSSDGFALAASSSSDSHTGRNVGIGLGGVAVLLIGLGGGFLLGRQRRTVA